MKSVLLLIPLLLVGCDESSLKEVRQYDLARESHELRNDSRFDMRVVDDFYDSNAHHPKRDIFIITDNKTHKQYLGVEGVGVTELSDQLNPQDYDDQTTQAAVSSAATATKAVSQ